MLVLQSFSFPFACDHVPPKERQNYINQHSNHCYPKGARASVTAVNHIPCIKMKEGGVTIKMSLISVKKLIA